MTVKNNGATKGRHYASKQQNCRQHDIYSNLSLEKWGRLTIDKINWFEKKPKCLKMVDVHCKKNGDN